MSSIISTLDDINFYVYVYVGLTELVIGTIGNALTVILFGQAPLRATRTALTIIVLAILNTIYLDFAITLRVMAGIRRQNDTTFGSDVLCRFFLFILYGCATAIVGLLVCIAVDRYLCSCRQASRRAWSTKRVLHTATAAILLTAMLLNMPYLILARSVVINPATGATACTIPNLVLIRFLVRNFPLPKHQKVTSRLRTKQGYFQVPVLTTLLPLLLLSIFGLLTIKNIRTVKQVSNHLERQMTRILLLQTMVVTFCLVPFASNSL